MNRIPLTSTLTRERIAKRIARYRRFHWRDIAMALEYFSELCTVGQLEEIGPLLCNVADFKNIHPLDVASQAFSECHKGKVKV